LVQRASMSGIRFRSSHDGSLYGAIRDAEIARPSTGSREPGDD
jgi:hypothetical protein